MNILRAEGPFEAAEDGKGSCSVPKRAMEYYVFHKGDLGGVVVVVVGVVVAIVVVYSRRSRPG